MARITSCQSINIQPMSETVTIALVTALAAAIPPTIVAIAALLQARTAAKEASKAVNVAVVTAGIASGKADELAEKTEVVHKLVNSNLTKVKDDLTLAQERIAVLEKMLFKKEEV